MQYLHYLHLDIYKILHLHYVACIMVLTLLLQCNICTTYIVILIIYLQCDTYITFIKVLTRKNSLTLHDVTYIMVV